MRPADIRTSKAAIGILLATSFLAAQQGAPAPTAKLPSSAEIKQILVDRIDRDKKSVGIEVGVIGPEGSRTVGYGKLDQASSAVPDENTVFEIGSMTKVFTSLLLADMVKKGEVKLDDPVQRYLPASVHMPTRDGKQITLVDLATHTSGLPRLPGNLHPKDPENPYADYTVQDMYDFLSSYTLTRDIGVHYDYSNLGVGLLGHVLALRAGMDYEALVVKRICNPLHMNSTRITLTPDMRARLVPGHTETLEKTKNWDLPTLAGAGALRSTAHDMLLFLSAELGYTKTPLAVAMEFQRTAVRRDTSGPNTKVALGWHITSGVGEDIVWHNGGTGGYRSYMGMDLVNRTGVIVLSNAANGEDDIGPHLLDPRHELAKFEAPKEHHAITLPANVLGQYVGKYELSPGFVLTITHEGDSLFAQATGQEKLPIFAESATEFFLKAVDAQLTFTIGPDGRATQVTLHQGGGDMPGKRVEQ